MLLPSRMSAVAAALVTFLLAVSTAAAAGPLWPAGPVGPHHRDVPAPGYSPGFDWYGPLGATYGSLGSALVGSVPNGIAPSGIAVDSATNTL
jgi:hypothetical protein